MKLPWPCGTQGNVEIPSLFVGLAGIGYFYLRLADTEAHSVGADPAAARRLRGGALMIPPGLRVGGGQPPGIRPGLGYQQPGGSWAASIPAAAPANPHLFLETAHSIGLSLCRSARWQGALCTWLGPSTEPVGSDWQIVHRLYGPEVYHGTAGNALFLSQLYRSTGDPLVRSVAEGAMRYALSQRHQIPANLRVGFYTGWAGLAYACVELGEALEDPRWTDAGLKLFRDLRDEDLDVQALDVLAGYAGGLAALLNVHQRLSLQDPEADLEDLMDLAKELGEKLLDRAHRREEGWSWDTTDGGSQDHLTGFSHGAAGIAWSLLELYDATRDERFLEAGLEGFRYERHWYSADEENWPDLRDPELLNAARGPNPTSSPLTCPHLWCHGAPGIGLSRLRGWQITGEAGLREEAEAALRSTTRDLQNHLGLGGNYSLCHGLAGNAELLIYGSEILAEPAIRELAEQIGLVGIHRHGSPASHWPSGMMGSPEAPNLMLGLAGTGYFYLRLYDAKTPPVLILPRSSGAGQGGESAEAGLL